MTDLIQSFTLLACALASLFQALAARRMAQRFTILASALYSSSKTTSRDDLGTADKTKGESGSDMDRP